MKSGWTGNAKLCAGTCSSTEASRSRSGSEPKQPRGLICTLRANGLVPSAGGGWNRRAEHTANQGLGNFPRGQSPKHEGKTETLPEASIHHDAAIVEIDGDNDDQQPSAESEGFERSVNLRELGFDRDEAAFLNDFRNGVIQEEELHEVLDCYKDCRVQCGTGPSKIRVIDICQARSESNVSHKGQRWRWCVQGGQNPPLPPTTKGLGARGETSRPRLCTRCRGISNILREGGTRNRHFA